MAASDLIPIWFLLQCLSYDPETGVLRWKERPRSHFPDERAHHTWNTRYAHTEAGVIRANGYRYIAITYSGTKRCVAAHRIAWALQTGEYPPFDIDHDDTNRAHNRFENLRPATRGENHQNRRGVRGTTFVPRRGKFYAQIGVGYCHHHLGSYPTEAEARQAYLDAKKKYHSYKPTPPETGE